MAEEDKSNPQNETEELSRRRFFVKSGVGSLMAAGVGTAAFGYQFLSPNVLFEPSPIVPAGKAEQYPTDSVTLDTENGIYIVRAPEGFYALSAVCTHLGCLTAWMQELGIIACPCHGSKFQRTGTKIEGPAPRPLPWLKMWLNDEGELMVDRSAPISAGQFVRV